MELDRKLEIFILATIWVVFILHISALYFFLYWKIWWFDMLLHFLGGFFIGIVSIYLYYHSRYINNCHSSNIFVIILALFVTTLVGVFWEFFEYIVELFLPSSGSLVFVADLGDSLSDLFFDMVGGVVAALLYIFIWKKG